VGAPKAFFFNAPLARRAFQKKLSELLEKTLQKLKKHLEHLHTLKFEAEVPLTAEPLRIDLIIRKPDAVDISKNIARIFRKENIVEYKSPHDYFSVRDFLKAEVYARMYAIANQEIPLEDVTLSFVESRRPRTLLRYLRKKRRYTIQEVETGIYRIMGDCIPMQIIETKKLSEGENLWLKSYTSELKARTLEDILTLWKLFSETLVPRATRSERKGTPLTLVPRAKRRGYGGRFRKNFLRL